MQRGDIDNSCTGLLLIDSAHLSGTLRAEVSDQQHRLSTSCVSQSDLSAQSRIQFDSGVSIQTVGCFIWHTVGVAIARFRNNMQNISI